MRRITQAVAFFSVVTVSATLFQNCGAYAPLDNPLYGSNLGSECVGVSCSSEVDAVQLEVSTNPLVVKKPTSQSAGCDASNCVDVAGYCEVAGFPNSNIYVEISGPGINYKDPNPRAKCDAMGRFRFLLQIPAGFQFDGSLYNVVVTLKVVDENGVEQTNPAGLHRKDVQLTSVQ